MTGPPWTYAVRQGGLMRCCLQSLGDQMLERLQRDDGPPADGDRVDCVYCKGKMIHREGAWMWAEGMAAEARARSAEPSRLALLDKASGGPAVSGRDIPSFDSWWESRSINDRLMYLHHDRAGYTEEGWDAGIAAERARLREKVEGLVGFWDNHPSKRLDGPERRLVNEIFGEVLALLDKPEGARP